MSDKILLYLDGWFFHFAIAYHLQKKYDCELSAIIDIDEKAKKFFQEQQIVKFNKQWFIRNHILLNNDKVDLDYLRNFEKKYQINLWSIVYAEKTFYSPYLRYKFKEKEILSLLEKEGRFFEKILDELKPKFFLTMIPVPHYHQLICAMCKSKGIKVLMLSTVKFANKVMISEDNTKFDDISASSHSGNQKKRSNEEIRNYLKNFDPAVQINKLKKEAFEDKKFKRYQAVLKFFFTNQEVNDKNYYSHYGITKPKIFFEKISRSLSRKYRNSFLKNSATIKPNTNRPFVYFPLHYEPERILLVDAKFYDNQFAVITNIAKSLPIDYLLYVKEHPMMETLGWRPISVYKSIMNLPNVVLLHPSISSDEILKKCSLVVTIAGTTGQEAAFYEKPVILLSTQLYSMIPFVYTIKKIEDLPKTIKLALKEKPKILDLNKFIDLVEKNSFEFNITHIATDFAYRFGYKGPIMEAEIPISKLKEFLNDYNTDFEKLACEHIKKMNQFKKLELEKKK